jgi:hypothetical protein
MAQLCDRGILLKHGAIAADGPIRDVIEDYLGAEVDHRSSGVEFPAEPSKAAQILSVAILRGDGTPTAEVDCDEPFVVRIEVAIREKITGLRIWFTLLNLEGIRTFNTDVRDADPSIVERLEPGRHAFEITIPARLLAPMTYLLSTGCASQHTGLIDGRLACCEFTLRDLQHHRADRVGFFGVLLPWEHEPAGTRPVPVGP